MMWPFNRSEKRESSLTDTLIATIVASASGRTLAQVSATGALEAASGLVARCFASATLEGPAHLTAALSPCLLSTIGRALIRSGELVMQIDVDPSGRVRLFPAADFDVTGDHEAET